VHFPSGSSKKKLNLPSLILDFGFWVLDFGFWILDFGYWILDFGFLLEKINE